MQRTLDSTINLSKTRKRITFSCFNFISLDFIAWGSKGWPNVERTRFPPVWPGFNFLGVNAIIMWVEFVVASLLCFKKLYSGYSYPQEPAFINPNSTRNSKKKKEPLCGCATLKSLFIHLYLFTNISGIAYLFLVYLYFCKEWLFCGRKGTLQPLELLEIWSCLHNII